MKKLIYSLIITVLVLTGCGEGFLDRAPLDSINTSNYPQNEEDLVALVNGAYQPLQWPKLYNMRMWTSDIFAGNSVVGAAGGSDGIETQDLANFVTSTDNQGVLDIWRGPWPGILRCNNVLKVAADLDIDQDIKERSMGEAYFLRAHYYFILVRFFGDVPLITEPQSPGDDLRVKREDKSLVYDQIIGDLQNAMEMLPERSSYSTIDIGRASKGAAAGMLAKVYLTLGNYQEVIPLCNLVETLGYQLNADYADNFDPLNGNSIESLFEVQYNSDGGYDFWSNENQASWTSTFMGPRGSGMVAGGWGWNQPTQEFVDCYEPGDLRKDVSILYDGCPDFEGEQYKGSYSFTGYNVRKFLVPKSVSASYDNSPVNFPVLRYADVLLMKAEALNETDDADVALAPLNLVRQRAGLAPLSGLNHEQCRAAIIKERRIELAFEGQRWFDLVRLDNGQYGLNFLHSIGKTNASEKHLLLPIPQKERDVNPNLAQNPGY